MEENELLLPPETTPKQDPWTVSEDGHYVGHDQFVVPRNFEEFYSRYPDWTKYVAMGLLHKSFPDDKVEDLEQELLMHLACIPASSKYHAMGYTDRIQLFDPAKFYGCNAARFFGYLKMMLERRYFTMLRSDERDPVTHEDTLSIVSGYHDLESGGCITPELMASAIHEDFSRVIDPADVDRKVFLDGLRDFVAEDRPGLIPLLDAIRRGERRKDITAKLGVSDATISNNVKLLIELGKVYAGLKHRIRRRRSTKLAG